MIRRIGGNALFLILVCLLPTLRAESVRELANTFNEAERLFWLDNWVTARDLYAHCEESYARSDPERAMISKFSRLRADAETKLSYTTVSRMISQDLQSRVARGSEKVRLRGMIVRATADLSVLDPSLSGDEWQQVHDLAHGMKEEGWATRAEGELGIVAYLRGDIENAVKLNTATFEKEKQVDDVAGMVRALSLKGVGLLERKSPDRAAVFFEQALSLTESHPDVRFPLMAYMGKAQALEMKGDDSAASDLLNRAKLFVDRIGMTAYRADLLNALGNLAEKRGRLDEAQSNFEEAAAAATRAQMPRPYADATFHLVELRAHSGDLSGAERLLNAGLKADRKLIDVQFFPGHLALAARVESRLGHLQAAEAYLSQAIDVIEAALIDSPSAKVKTSLITTMSEVYSAQFELTVETRHDLPLAFEKLETARGQVIADHLRAQSQRPRRADAAANILQKRIAQVQLKLLSSNRVPQRRRLLQDLQEAEYQLEPLEFTHVVVDASQKVPPLSLAQLQDNLKEDELLLEYVLGNEKSYALAITKTNATSYMLPKEQIIRTAVQAYAEEIESTVALPEESRSKARLLFDLIVSPISEMRTHARIIFVPDGVLNLIGFDSLVDRDHRFLVRSHTISYAPSATVMMTIRKRSAIELISQTTLLAFGGPQQGGKPQPSSDATNRAGRSLLDPNAVVLPPLRSAGGEVREIARDLGGSNKVFTGAQATEAELKRQSVNSFQVIHFATHAFADFTNPDRSAIVLTPDVRSGDDGLLQIREIREMNLHTSLVTLSACDAGLGKTAGIQGLESLVNAFIFAGARSVLASRWAANDTFTATLMDRVYRNIAGGMRVSDALRQAQLDLLSRYGPLARPSYWSAFFVSGDSDTKIYAQPSQPQSR